MEIWRDVPGFEERYQVSNLGRVKSKSYIRFNGFGIYQTKELILKPFMETCGHLKVCLYKDGKIKRVKIHRLVASVFIPNPENKPEVDHIDTDTTNNTVWNLRWVTSRENKMNPITHQRMVLAHKGKNTKPVFCKNKISNKILHFTSIKDAGEYLNIDTGHITDCCKGKRKSAGGYIWNYE